MKKLISLFCALLFLTVTGAIPAFSNNVNEKNGGWHQNELSSGWKLRKIYPCENLSAQQLDSARIQDPSGWYTITRMPIMVHDVLLANKIIEEPWLPGRAEACKWVAESDWLYALNFGAKPEDISFLRFKGLDVIADIYLNGKFLASHCNMHLPLRLDVTDELKKQNTLVIHFHSPFRKAGERIIPINEFKGIEVRHSTHNYDNYLGAVPYFCRIGVYGDILLETTGGSELADVSLGADLNNEMNTGTINVGGSCIINSGEGILRITVSDENKKVVSRKDIRIKSGDFSAQLIVSSPELWWPRGYGKQPLYSVDISLLQNNKVHQVISRKVGFRKITMPEHLHFTVNGKRVYLWGACFVTPHWQTAVYDKDRVEQLFTMAANANMNTLRTWADVECFDDHFYEVADSMGFLVWHDFPQMFQGLPNIGPGEKTRNRCIAEATYQVNRFKHHPSIFLWCGGNEEPLWIHKIFNGFNERGPWRYEALANEIGGLCRNLDPSRIFLPSTPWNNTEPNDPATETHGYTHLWYVPGYNYINFASEDTRISVPVLPSLKKFIAPEDLWPSDYSPLYTPGTKAPFPQTWRKYAGESSSYRKVGPVEQFYDAEDAESAVQRIGMAAGLYYQQTIERQRHGRPADDTSSYRRCGGYLVWKLNDSWPQIYSAKIDYFLEPQHPYYSIRRAFSPLLLSFEVGNYIWLWITNDTQEKLNGNIEIKLFHIDENSVHKEITRTVTIQPGESKVIARLDTIGIRLFRREHILSARLINAGGKEIASTVALADIERHITFPDASLKVNVSGNIIEITTDKFARTITLKGNADGDETGWFFDDNYFDLVPGEQKIVHILGKHSSGTITIKPWYAAKEVSIDWKKE